MSEKWGISRRRFLAAAGIALSSGRALGHSSVNGAMSVGVIGLGERGSALLAELQARSDVRVTAVCDAYEPRRERARAVRGVEVCRDWSSLVERRDIDAVVVATPEHWHAPMTVAALACGKDVYCERPMALTASDAEAVRDAVAYHGRVLQVGVQETSEGQWHTARASVLAPGRLGRVRWAQGPYGRHARRVIAAGCGDVTPYNLDWRAFLGPAPHVPFDHTRFLGWRAYGDYSGGVTTDVLYAQLAPLVMALELGVPAQVSAAGGLDEPGPGDAPDALVATLVYPEGATLVLASSVATRRRDMPAVVRGSDGTLYAEGVRLRVTNEDDTEERVIAVPERADHVTDWLDAVRARRRPVCHEGIGYRTSVAMDMVLQAYREGVTVTPDRPTASSEAV